MQVWAIFKALKRRIPGNTMQRRLLADSAKPREQHTAWFRCVPARRRFTHYSRERYPWLGLGAECTRRPARSAIASFGGKMTRTPGIFFALLIITAVPSAKAGGTVNIKCAPNEDRVWVYESLTDFNVAAKLKCGDPVQIVERVKGYVKIQTSDGTEGYVLDTSFPKSALPPAPVEKPNDVESAAVAFAARRGARAPDNSVDAPASARPSAPVAVASTAPPAVVKPVAPSQPPPQTTVTLSATGAAAPTVAAQPQPTPPATAVIARNSTSASSANSAPVAENVPAATPTRAAYKAPAPSKAALPAPAPQPAPVTVAAATAPRATPVVAVSAPAPVLTTPARAPAAATVSNPAPVATASNVSVSARTPAPDDSSNASTMTIETSATLQPVADATPHAPISVTRPSAKRPADPDGDEDSEVAALNNEQANCTQYFSAYGLSANQYKWLAQNRRKAFPSVCPAPSPSQVDFVVIFTHDVPFYNVTMPNAVHTDGNGFSDWTPLTTVDTAVISATDADKSHHEYVWVFHTNRGAFDPSKFSSRRRPLYSKAETNMLGSRGGFRTVMDALTFIEQNGTNR
jgi:Bacterial SH3 domain